MIKINFEKEEDKMILKIRSKELNIVIGYLILLAIISNPKE